MTHGKVTFGLVLLMLISLNVASSQDITENLTEINESDPTYWYNRGEELLHASKYNESIGAFDDRYDEAIEAFDEAIKLNSSEPSYWNGKGDALYFQEKYDEAVEAYDEAIKLNSSEPKYWSYKSSVFF